MSTTKDTSFGSLIRWDMGIHMLGRVEFIRLDRPGTPHMHDDCEHAFTVAGSGVVFVDGVSRRVYPGVVLTIPHLSEHYMVPDEGQTLEMIITYSLR